MGDIEELVPSKPSPPLPSDCCGSGCSPCVSDIYEEDLRKWKKKCKANRAIDPVSPNEQIISCSGYTPFQLVSMKQISPDTLIYTFKLPENRELGIAVGQHVIIKGSYNNKVVTRPYTPITELTDEGNFEILIKIYPKGKMSSVVKEWKVGDKIEMRGPYGVFTYKRNSFKSIVMLAAGTGIAPIYRVIKAILSDEEDMTKIMLLYSSQRFGDILLREELYGLHAYWNFTVRHYLSKEIDSSGKKYGEEVELHRITKEEAEKAIQKETPGNTLILISGTKSFEKDMINAALNVSSISEHIFRF